MGEETGALPQHGERIPRSQTSGSAAKNPIEQLEAVLKLLAGTLGLVTALGLPAVLLQYASYGIPAYFVTAQRALKAGVLPTILLLCIGGYIYLTVRSIRQGNRQQRTSLVSGWGALPIILAAGILGGTIFLMLLNVFEFLIVVVRRALSVQGGVIQNVAVALGLTPGEGEVIQDFVAALSLTVLFGVTMYWLRKPISRRMRIAVHALPRRLPKAVSDLVQSEGRPQQFAVSFIVMLVIVSAANVSTQLVLSDGFLSVAGVFALSAFLASSVDASIVLQKLDYPLESMPANKALDFTVKALLPLFLTAVLLYSSVVYPTLPSYLGGGATRPLTLWIEKETMPASRDLIGWPDVIEEGDLVRLEKLHLLEANDAFWILVRPGYQGNPWLAIPTSAVKAVSR